MCFPSALFYIPMFEAFVPDADHTLASLLRASLPLPTERAIAGCHVADPACDAPGVTICAETREDALAAIDQALAWVRATRAAHAAR